MSIINTQNKNIWLLAACMLAIFMALIYASFDSLVEMERMWSTKE